MPKKSDVRRIADVSVGVFPDRKRVLISWRGGGHHEVDLSGWIATGGDDLAPLSNPETFAKARVAHYGSAIAWNDGDLSIDAVHLRTLAEEQKPFSPADLAAWQNATKLSNQEAADFLGVALSTFNLYKSRGPVPPVVGMVCRASGRDPVLLQAHYRPRKAGRPKSGRKREAA
jgi:hypothetical protein